MLCLVILRCKYLLIKVTFTFFHFLWLYIVSCSNFVIFDSLRLVSWCIFDHKIWCTNKETSFYVLFNELSNLGLFEIFCLLKIFLLRFLLVFKISKKNNTRNIIPLGDVTHGLLVTSKSRFFKLNKIPLPIPHCINHW